MSTGINAHGTLVYRQPAATPGVFTAIGNLGDVTPPALSRNSADVTAQADNIDFYVMGVLRRSELTFPVFFASGEATHTETSGLYYSMINKSTDGWKIVFPDNFTIIFSGAVSNLGHSQPVEGGQVMNVSIRPSGLMKINSTTIG